MSNEAFTGKIGRTREESIPAWPEQKRAKPGSPNIVIILMDDMGWSDPGCFGSEIDTPHINALAARGVRLTHYTTHPICSPARAALLTGCNAHSVGTGWLANNHPGYPGYSGEIPLEAATLPETFRAAGYETIMVGKWHNTPTAENSQSGSKHNWPTQRGFDTFYGFMDGETNHFFPARLMLGNQVLPVDEYPRDYYTGDDWMDQGIRFIKELRESSPTKPFFLYVANNAMHAPLQAKPSDMAKYKGTYDKGWTAVRESRFKRQIEMGLIPANTKLPTSDQRVPNWNDTDQENRPLYSRHMEAYAGMLDNADQNVGKLVEYLKEIGELDNTIILFSSDNGGTDAGGEHGMVLNNRRISGLPNHSLTHERNMLSQLGGPQSNSLYPTAWGEVSNTPFPSFKTYTGGGGRRVSFIASWPSRIKDYGSIRHQFMHVTDVMPTLLDLANVNKMEVSHGKTALSLDGKSCAKLLIENAPSPRSEQYYECWSNRAFYKNGWLARSLQVRDTPIDMDNWTLHNLEDDFSECLDLARDYPEKLKELTEAFDAAAWQHLVYPLDNRSRPRKFSDTPAWMRELSNLPRRFLPGAQTTSRIDVIPMVGNRSFCIRACFHHRVGDAGILWALGDTIGGMVMYLESERLNFHYNGFGVPVNLIPVGLKPGEHEVILEYEALGNRRGQGRLLVDGIEKTDWTEMTPTLMLGPFEGLDVGIDRRAPVFWELYERHGSYRYTGKIKDVWIHPGERAVA